MSLAARSAALFSALALTVASRREEVGDRGANVTDRLCGCSEAVGVAGGEFGERIEGEIDRFMRDDHLNVVDNHKGHEVPAGLHNPPDCMVESHLH